MEPTAQPSFIEERPVVTGLLLVLVTLAATFWLPTQWALETFATLLTLIGAIYVGMAVVQMRQLYFQFAVALGFMFAGLLGLWLSPWFLVAGYLAHGLWDWLHHNHKMPVKLTDWYAPFCLVYDWGVALIIVIWWL